MALVVVEEQSIFSSVVYLAVIVHNMHTTSNQFVVAPNICAGFLYIFNVFIYYFRTIKIKSKVKHKTSASSVSF